MIKDKNFYGKKNYYEKFRQSIKTLLGSVLFLKLFGEENNCVAQVDTSQKSQLQNSNSYVLAVGEKGNHRLNTLNKVYGSFSQNLIKRIKLLKSMKVLSLGCGNGNMEVWLAEQVGPEGDITAIDISQDQLNIAKERAKENGIENIKFLQGDASKINYENQFDLVYTRFMLVHLPLPQQAVKQMCKALKPGGVILCEEMINSWTFSYPDNPELNRAVKLINSIGDKRNVDYDFGLKLYSLFYKQTLKNIQINISNPVFSRGEEKELLALSIIESKDNYIKEKLIDESEINQMIKELFRIVGDESTILGLAPLVQVYAYK